MTYRLFNNLLVFCWLKAFLFLLWSLLSEAISALFKFVVGMYNFYNHKQN